MATIKQFEDALTAKGVYIKRIKQSKKQGGVTKVIGRIEKTYRWDKNGKAYNKQNERVVDLDIKL